LNTPLVSIIIPTYNRAHLIGETLDSVLAQTYQNWECIVVDDGSTDYTDELLEFYCQKDSRIQYHHRPQDRKKGANACRNYGLELSKGEYVVFLDSDDIFIETTLQERIKFLNLKVNQNPDLLLFHTGTFKYRLGDSNLLWNRMESGELVMVLIFRFLNSDMPCHTTGILWKRKFIIKIGYWNENLNSWQDWEMHIKALMMQPVVSINTGPPDTFYRLNVSKSIATKKRSLAYLDNVANAIKSIESISLGNQTYPIFKNDIKNLIYRSLVHYPIKLNNLKASLKIIFNYKFKSVSRKKLLKVFFIELLSKSHSIRNFLDNHLDLCYYKKRKIQNSFLKVYSK